jgi:flagellar hook-basal body complex protein FliE
MVDVKLIDAAQAYGDAVKRNSGIDVGGDLAGIGGDSTNKAGFADFLEDAVNGTMDAVQKSEAISIKAAGNQAEIVDVIAAVTNADITLQTIIAVRDKVVSAYQDVMRMPI